MKKIIPLVLFILIVGFIGFFFLNNNLAMTTLISQDYGKIAETYNKGVKGITGHSKYYYENETKTYVAGKVSTTSETKISIILNGENVSKIYGTVSDTNYELEVYYEVGETETLTYVTKTPKGEEPIKTIYNDATADYVLDTILNAKPVMFALSGVAEKTTLQTLTEYTEQDKAQFKGKVSSNFSFKPFGAKFKLTVSDTESYMAGIDVLGKLHSIEYKSGTATDYTIKTTDFVKFDKVSIYWKNQSAFSGVTPEGIPTTPESTPGE